MQKFSDWFDERYSFEMGASYGVVIEAHMGAVRRYMDEMFGDLSPAATASEIMAEMLHDPVTAPGHYQSHPSGIEVIEITRHMPFDEGNAVKYILRAGHKGRAVQDRKKAIWYLLDSLLRDGCDEEAIAVAKAALDGIKEEENGKG